MTNQFRKYQAVDFATATVSLKIFENDEHGLHHVIRTQPMLTPSLLQIGPAIWRFEKRHDAEEHFDKICAAFETAGWKRLEERNAQLAEPFRSIVNTFSGGAQ